MLIFCRTREVHPLGARWRYKLPFGWELRWQRPNSPVVAVCSHSSWRHVKPW
jgi:hypothetical protein